MYAAILDQSCTGALSHFIIFIQPKLFPRSINASPNSYMKFTTMVVVGMLATRVFAGPDEVAQYFITATQTLLMIKPSSKTRMRLYNPLIYILF